MACLALLAVALVPLSNAFSTPSFHLSRTHTPRFVSARKSGGGTGLQLRMADGMFDRIGRVAKDKLDGAKVFIDETAKADGSVNVRGAAAGALAGGVVAGPFGAVIGGLLGKGAGSDKAAQKEEAKRLGLTPELMLMIQELDSEVTMIREDWETVKNARDNLVRRKRSLESDAEEYYTRAKKCLSEENEDGARTALTYRQTALDALPQVERDLDDAEFRCEQFKKAMDVMEGKLKDVLDMQRRAASASASVSEISAIQDPLIEKFRKWENE
eukprot:CAMPEP_0114138838 /NCGR_PEP_ID=MMETSP0043_2-20121206/16540_1 /TAXON_ID=464988 /ORGANISM="Hemiselmis andersenii, Strain CCMP644" /LENGTH=270 /DNA_ID=CAMNT_0001232843 /DNA_START=42 /DNA_END=854 /DNA_ORIENTATION=+